MGGSVCPLRDLADETRDRPRWLLLGHADARVRDSEIDPLLTRFFRAPDALPITVDVARVRIALVGNGEAARRRLGLLDDAGATRVAVYADAPEPDLALAAGDRLRLPTAEEIARTQLVFLARVSERTASRLLHIVDSAGVLLNVEDDIARSDFHSPSIVRRGDLTLAISTGGKSPGLAAAIRRQIEASFGSELGVRLENIAVPPAQGGRRRRARPEPYG
jgi:precorrin-2 dehydrogenase/sirohydrochlorin ferrochelatase